MTTHRLTATALSAGYGDSLILEGLDLAVPPGRITAIVGTARSRPSRMRLSP